jgi:uncharacterized damage-inducible protein DinB
MSAKEAFLKTYDEEHGRTMRLLRAFPTEKLETRPSPKLKTARELAWVFVIERGLGTKLWNDEFAKGVPAGGSPPPPAPQNWNDLLGAIEKAHKDFAQMVRKASDDDLQKKTHFLVGPKKMGEMTRMDMLWFLLHDEIHHRGQFSIYQRIAGGKVPSIYGPTADEQWF